MDKNNASTTASADGYSANAVTSASAAIATIPNDKGSNDDNFEDDLEEGEIADDDDNDIDDDFANNNNNNHNNNSNSTNTYADGVSITNSNNTNISNNNNASKTGGKKKVVKRVKVIKRVKKKVKKKKLLAGSNEGNNETFDTTQALRVNSTLSVVGQNRTFSVQNSNISSTHNPMMHMPKYGPLLPKRQDPSLEEQEKQRLLCEQQIKMLQAQQQNAPKIETTVVSDDADYKLILASAMDEDLRILPNLFNPLSKPLQQAQLFPTVVSQSFPNIITTTPLNFYNSNVVPPLLPITKELPLLPIIDNNPVKTMDPRLMPNINQLHEPNQRIVDKSVHEITTAKCTQVRSPEDTTSKTDDDELNDSTRTSSSYDAINKMLTMLRQSTQETNEGTPNDDSTWQSILGSPTTNPLDPRAKKSTSRHLSEDNQNTLSMSNLDLVSYRLVPITIDSIDYSEYRILALTDQKLKNDPRLNRQQDGIIS